jgi:hypothetical protein
VHEIVEALAALEKVIDTTHDAEYAKGENPYTDYSNDAGPATHEQSKDGEQGSDDINN